MNLKTVAVLHLSSRASFARCTHLLIFHSTHYSLVHPLSPRGKLVHWGREGIDATSRLVAAAAQQEPNCILRDKLYRVAMTDRNVEDMAKTLETNKNNVKDYCRWVDKDELDTILGSTKTMGGLELSNGCSVIHVPTYLKGLYAACQEIGTIEWRPAADLDIDSHDVVVWAGGAGMLQDGTFDQTKLPVDMVRGQSLELKPSADAKDIAREAALCGKYTSPLLDNRMLVGATHEFAEEALSQDELYQELKDRSYDLSPNLWDYSTVDRVTCGYRVQSQRGALGRLPIVGHLTGNQWVFTGLSSRGLLYHGVYGGKLAEMILSGDQGESIVTENPHLNWWK
jgi:glycine/D-amino acid oxidase-like deaminating enzyme